MNFRRQVKVEDNINLTPLIDVVFLLLIFFMVSTTFTKETHLEIDLPEADTEQQTRKKNQIEVVIDARGNMSVNGQSLVNKQLGTLENAIKKMSKNNTKLPFIITGDANASYESIVNVMDLAGKMGFANLSMTTKSPSSVGSNNTDTK